MERCSCHYALYHLSMTLPNEHDIHRRAAITSILVMGALASGAALVAAWPRGKAKLAPINLDSLVAHVLNLPIIEVRAIVALKRDAQKETLGDALDTLARFLDSSVNQRQLGHTRVIQGVLMSYDSTDEIAKLLTKVSQADYAAGRVVYVDRWILTRTHEIVIDAASQASQASQADQTGQVQRAQPNAKATEGKV